MSSDSNQIYISMSEILLQDPYFLSQFKKFIPKKDSTFNKLTIDIIKSCSYLHILNDGIYPELKIYTLNPFASVERGNYLIMSNLVMLNWYQCLNIKSKAECSRKLHDIDYQNGLKERALSQFHTRCLFSESETSLLYAFTPPLYYIHGIINELERTPTSAEDQKITLETMNSKNFVFKYNTITECFDIVRSICTLIELSEYSNAYALMRTLIEMIITYNAVKNKSTANVNKYIRWQKFKKKYTHSTYWRNKYKKQAEADGKEDKLRADIVNYGWVNYLVPDKRINKGQRHNPTFKNVLNAPCTRSDRTFNHKWYKMYVYCNQFVHANYFRGRPDNYHFLTLVCALSELTIFLANEFKTNFNVTEIKIGNANLVEKLECAFKEAKEYRKKQRPNRYYL